MKIYFAVTNNGIINYHYLDILWKTSLYCYFCSIMLKMNVSVSH